MSFDSNDFKKQIEMWPIDNIIENARNPKKHPPEQIAQIAASIKEFRVIEPLIVDERGILISGHGRYSACRQLGYKEVPVIQFSHLTHSQKKALTIALNKLVMNSGFDMEILRIDLEELKTEGFNLDLTGFDIKDFNSIFINDNEKKKDEPKGAGLEIDLIESEKEQVGCECPKCGHKYIMELDD